jgi:hypothetical protein
MGWAGWQPIETLSMRRTDRLPRMGIRAYCIEAGLHRHINIDRRTMNAWWWRLTCDVRQQRGMHN